jgi:6-phosphogluconolactonase
LHTSARVVVYKDTTELAKGAADYILSAIGQTLTRQERFSLVLSGGSTPKAVYALLGQPPLVEQVSWSKVHFFWGDERCVPPDHADSNYRMAYETLLAQLALPPKNIHRILGEIPPEEAAVLYEQSMTEFFGEGIHPPRFDLVLLGIGEDGHTASLFPGSPALDESRRWTVAVEHTRPPIPLVARITMTLPLLNAARRIALIVSGAAKAEIMRRALSRAGEDPELPVQRLHPEDGEMVWLLDESAAHLVPA